uniref:DUF4371 domain-containing protein n=1 Tax=Latimeria chalumnae TaxID=7897 RepID=H2ZX62_LATCH
RTFQGEREKYIFFVEGKGENCLCLICDSEIVQHKQSNLKRHYVSCRTSKQAVLASFKIVHEIVKKVMPCMNGELVKGCTLLACNIMFPEKAKEMEIQLSDSTIARRVLATVCQQMFKKLCRAEYTSLAVDESPDIDDIPQLPLFVKAATSELDITEDFLDMIPLYNGTKGEDMKKAVMDVIKEFEIAHEKITAITTNGAPAMTGKTNGAVAVLKNKLKSDISSHNIASYYYVIHQQCLFAKCTALSTIMKEVIDLVNFLSRYHQQFKNLVEDFIAQYSDLVIFTEIRWLLCTHALAHVMDLFDPIKLFIIGEIDNFPYLDDTHWIQSVAFLCDITHLLNELNLKMQGKNKSLYETYSSVKSFAAKLQLLHDSV